jgi:site-specific DNA-methyltransferase (adenine-specific)
MCDCRIIQGDCLDILSRLERGSVDLMLADPPCSRGIDDGPHYDDSRASADYLAWCKRWIDASVPTLADDGSMWVLISDEWAAEFDLMLRNSGLTRRSWVIWYESFGVNCIRKFNRCKRHLFHTVRDPKRFTFNREAVSIASARLAKYGDKRANPAGKVMDDVWNIPRIAGTFRERIKGFPTQLPVELLRRIVGCSSNPGDLVVDLFSGSATTGVVCIQTGRGYLGVELSPRFAELSRQRLASVQRSWCVEQSEIRASI